MSEKTLYLLMLRILIFSSWISSRFNHECPGIFRNFPLLFFLNLWHYPLEITSVLILYPILEIYINFLNKVEGRGGRGWLMEKANTMRDKMN